MVSFTLTLKYILYTYRTQIGPEVFVYCISLFGFESVQATAEMMQLFYCLDLMKPKSTRRCLHVSFQEYTNILLRAPALCDPDWHESAGGHLLGGGGA